MFERLKRKRISPYVLCYFSYIVYSFFLVSFFCLFLLILEVACPKVHYISFIPKSFDICFIDFIGWILVSVSGLFEDRVIVKHLLDKKNDDVDVVRDIVIRDKVRDSSFYYADSNMFVDLVYDEGGDRLKILYKRRCDRWRKEKDYFRFIADVNKYNLFSAWLELDPDFKMYPYEFVVYRRSRVLKEVRLCEDYDYPVEIREIVDVFNQMYP